MEIHLVSVKIGVVGVAVGVVHVDCFFLTKHVGLVGHHGWLVEGGLTVDEEVVT
jgi:hypothetical protein